MKSLLCVFVTTALVSELPYLLSFDSKHFSYHGLFCMGVLVTFMLFMNLKAKFCTKFGQQVLLAVSYFIAVIVSLLDISNIFLTKESSAGLFYFLPFATCAIALYVLTKFKPIRFKSINLTLFSFLFLHLFVYSLDPSLPLLEFAILKFFL